MIEDISFWQIVAILLLFTIIGFFAGASMENDFKFINKIRKWGRSL